MPPEPYNMVITHGSCADGWCSAWIAYRAGCQNAEFVHAHHGEKPPSVKGKSVLMTDFSYPRSTMLALIAEARDITVLDHHKTAEEALLGLANDAEFGYGLPRPTIVFDQKKSGAMLTWEHFFPDLSPPLLVQYVQDRDLWAWKLPHSREINASLRTYPENFARWDVLATSLESAPERFVAEGIAILRYQQSVVDAHVANAKEVVLAGHRVLAVNATVLISEIAGELARNRSFGVCWFRNSNDQTIISLRSDKDGLDVSEIAKQFGGGGHPRAAGYQQDAPFMNH